MSQKIFFVASMFVVLFFSVAEIEAAFLHDFVSDFSTTSNPNGVWRYDSVAIGGPNSTALAMVFPDNGAAGGFDWQDASLDTFSLIGNGFIHPGARHDTLVGFAFPDAVAEPVHVQLAFGDGNLVTGGDGKAVSLWNDNTQIGSTLILPDQFSGLQTVDFVETMTPGETFYIRLNGIGNNSFDGTTLAATFTSVPEPGSLVLFGLGAIGLLLAGRRRRKS